MDPMHTISSLNACSLTKGGSLWRNKCSTKSIYHASSCALKASQHKWKPLIESKFLMFQQPNLNHRNKNIGEGSTYQECNRKYVVQLTPKSYSDFESHASNTKIILDIFKRFSAAFFLFCSPYGMATHAISIISASLLAVQNLSNISPLFFNGVLQLVVPHLLMGVYIAGVNQLSDVEIDKINKPYLPLASGEISFTSGVIIAASCLTLSLWLGWIIGSWPLIWGLVSFGSVWTIYAVDVPLLRWKKDPFLAALCVFATWTFIFPISSFLHMQTFVFKRPTIFPRSLMAAIAFLSFYSIGIALCKDIPDVEGDSTFGIYSFPARFGKKRVFWICVSLLEMAFGITFLAGATSPYLWIKFVTGVGHVVLASILWYQAKSIDLKSKASIASFFMFIWKVLCAEYFLLPLIR